MRDLSPVNDSVSCDNADNRSDLYDRANKMRTRDADKAIEAIKELRMEYRIPHTDSNGERIHFYEMVLIGSEVKGVFDGIIQALESIAEVGE